MPCELRDDSAAETPVVPSFLTPGVPIDVFLTGARGYIGVAVAKRLIRDGHTVRGLTRTPEGGRCVRSDWHRPDHRGTG
ncbi:NAD-dependent epimerase/dehydratase family protein [Mycolicibacterium sp. jd]|uniref:NAD-dependent epimerase/dehydratase family protein n=1 Tax=unclassified Mycolicibacterium TaxID=2636767 RepID=UPI00351AD8EC